MPIDIDHLRSWIGRKEIGEDVITPVPIAALAATLDRDDPKPRPGDELPPLWHWLYFLPTVRQSELGPDGHPKRGGFLPPVPLPRRMWAGARFEFHRPLHIGEAIVRKSTIAQTCPRPQAPKVEALPLGSDASSWSQRQAKCSAGKFCPMALMDPSLPSSL